MLVVSVFNRLSALPLDDIASLLSNLSSSPAVSKFKIALFQRYFSDSSEVSRTGVRPRPQARAVQPKGSPVKVRDPAQPVSLANKYRAPASAEILRLMEAKTSTLVHPSASPCRIKFELLVSYNAFQANAELADKDPEWSNLKRNGAMSKTLDAAFGCHGAAEGDSAMYRDLLDTIFMNVLE
jgi:hypothetical protein